MDLSVQPPGSTPGSLLYGPLWRPAAGEQKTDRCQLASLLHGLAQAHFTGMIRVSAPADRGGGPHIIYLREGRVVHIRPPTLDEPLGHILYSMGLLDRDTYARSLLKMAEEQLRHGTVLRRMGVVTDEQVIGALSVQILRRATAAFRLREGRYTIEPSDHEYGKEGEVASVGVGTRRIIYHGVRTGYGQEDLQWELNLIAGRRFRIRRSEARRLGRYGFGPEARSVLEALSSEYRNMKELGTMAQPVSNVPQEIPQVVYALLVTDLLDVEPVSVAEPVPVAENSFKPTMPTLIPAARGAHPEIVEHIRRGTRPPGQSAEDMVDPREREAENRYVRGEGYLRKGDIDMALVNLRAAVHLRPARSDYKAMLAWAVWRDTRVDLSIRASRARRLLAEALARTPSCSQAYRVYGFIYEETGKLDQAIKCFEKVAELVAGDIEAAEACERIERKRNRGTFMHIFRRTQRTPANRS